MTAERALRSVGESSAPGLAPDSLLHIPLVRMMLGDPCVRFRRRAIDAEWVYRRTVPSTGGFNPALGAVYYGARSKLAAWLHDPSSGAREHNRSDTLLHEVLFAVHDYLHIWAYRVIRELLPRLEFGRAPVADERFEDHVFCHLLTEAAATVGLDYWYMCTLDINDVVDLGSTMSSLTVPYHDRHLAEYRRWCPSLEPQAASFFATVVDVYCRGVFPGILNGHVRQSPRLLSWMEKELLYGKRQRVYTREWLSFASGRPLHAPMAEIARPCIADKDWQREVITELGQLLWEKVKLGKVQIFGRDNGGVDEREYDLVPATGLLDFRFVNALRADLDDPAIVARMDPRTQPAEYAINQYVSRYVFDDELDTEGLLAALAARSFPQIKALCASLERVDAVDEGPGLLFFPA
jgi:hypothetical protein